MHAFEFRAAFLTTVNLFWANVPSILTVNHLLSKVLTHVSTIEYICSRLEDTSLLYLYLASSPGFHAIDCGKPGPLTQVHQSG